MDRRTALIYGLTGQEVEFYPPEYTEGVPTAAATYRVWAGPDSNDAAVQFEGTATRDETSLALDQASGYSQASGLRRRIYLGSTTGLVVRERLYVTENVLGQRELVRLKSIATNDYADALYDLANDYPATTSYLKGLRQSFVVDPTFIATVGKINDREYPYRVEWRYTVNSIARRHLTFFDVVRVARQHGVTVDDLYRVHPWLRQQEDRDRRGLGFQPDIDEGAEVFWRDLEQVGIDPDDVLEGQDRLIFECTMMVLADRGKAPPGREVNAWARERAAIYKRSFERTTQRGLKVSQSDDGALTKQIRQFPFVS